MCALFGSSPFVDPELGEFRRARGLWRGTLSLNGDPIPLALSGPRAGPDLAAVEVAREIASGYPSWRPAIETALFEHYEPYAEEGVTIGAAADVSSHANVVFVSVTPLDGQPVVEIGYEVAWDEEHTLGARIRDGQLLELSGSVLAP